MRDIDFDQPVRQLISFKPETDVVSHGRVSPLHIIGDGHSNIDSGRELDLMNELRANFTNKD